MSKIKINTESLKERREWKRHKIQDGNNVVRILPPFGELESHNNWPFRKWSYCWLVDPETNRRKPFASPYSFGGEACPIHEYSQALALQLDTISEQLKVGGSTREEIAAVVGAARNEQWKLKLQHGFFYNACDKSGEVGILELKATAHKALKGKMSQYIRDYGQDPTSMDSLDDDSGVWFNITKTGKMKDTEYGCQFNETMEKDESGRMVRIDDRSPLNDAVVDRYYDDLGYDVYNLYKEISYDELKTILAYNITALARDIPELAVDGFTDVDYVSPPVAVESAPKPQGKKKIALNLGDDEAPVAPKAVAPKAVAPVATAGSDDDIFAMADSILGD